MKRYKIKAIDTTPTSKGSSGLTGDCISYSSSEYPHDIKSIEDPKGEWVKYSDVEKEMKKIWGDIMPPPGDILKSLHKGTRSRDGTQNI